MTRAAARAIRPAGWTRIGLGLVLPLVLCGIWQIAAATGRIDTGSWASPVLVARALAAQLRDPQFLADTAASLQRDALGTMAGILTGLPAGLALGRSAMARKLFALPLDTVKSVPLLAFVPLLCVWVGSGEPGKITFIGLAAMLPVLFNTAQGAAELAAGQEELARLYRLSSFTRLRRVLLPAALPGILRGVHLALLYGWLATIGAEFLFEAGSGIGTDIMAARESYAFDLLTADILTIGAIGILLDLGYAGAEAYLLRWQADRS